MCGPVVAGEDKEKTVQDGRPGTAAPAAGWTAGQASLDGRGSPQRARDGAHSRGAHAHGARGQAWAGGSLERHGHLLRAGVGGVEGEVAKGGGRGVEGAGGWCKVASGGLGAGAALRQRTTGDARSTRARKKS